MGGGRGKWGIVGRNGSRVRQREEEGRGQRRDKKSRPNGKGKKLNGQDSLQWLWERKSGAYILRNKQSHVKWGPAIYDNTPIWNWV